MVHGARTKLDLEGERDDERVDIYVIGRRTWVREGPVEWLRVAHSRSRALKVGDPGRNHVSSVLPRLRDLVACLLVSPHQPPDRSRIYILERLSIINRTE